MAELILSASAVVTMFVGIIVKGTLLYSYIQVCIKKILSARVVLLKECLHNHRCKVGSFEWFTVSTSPASEVVVCTVSTSASSIVGGAPSSKWTQGCGFEWFAVSISPASAVVDCSDREGSNVRKAPSWSKLQDFLGWLNHCIHITSKRSCSCICLHTKVILLAASQGFSWSTSLDL